MGEVAGTTQKEIVEKQRRNRDQFPEANFSSVIRSGIGFAIGAARLPWPGWAVGLCFGLLLSIPDAIITKAYAPIIGMGALGGIIIGVIIGRFGQ
jgi:hypothetical protein